MTKQYKVGIYCRLSVDDASNSAKAKHYIPSEESVSIENQYEILSKFAMLNGWIEVKTYRDDGYSGGNFQRPGFLEMLEDARHGLINLILVKDLSRLGRDFVEVGRYTDVVFPSLGCHHVRRVVVQLAPHVVKGARAVVLAHSVHLARAVRADRRTLGHGAAPLEERRTAHGILPHGLPRSVLAPVGAALEYVQPPGLRQQL